MKYLLLSLMSLVCCGLAMGQSIERQLVSSSGGQLSNGSSIVTQSVGEAVTGDLTSSSATAYQGYQQADDFFVSIQQALNTDVSVFPNPFHASITINGNASFDYLKLYDMQGKLIRTINLSQASTVELSDLSTGLYHLKLFSSHSDFTSSHQIQKL